MRSPVVRFLGALPVAALIAAPLAGRAQERGAKPPARPAAKAAPAKPAVKGEFRTPWGDPDLQGAWDNGTPTPLERPNRIGDKAVYTDAEVKKLNADAADAIVHERPGRAGDVGTYNELWFERGPWLAQTALITDPPNGKMPPLTAEALKKLGPRGNPGRGNAGRGEGGRGNAGRGENVGGEGGRGENDNIINGPEDRNLRERCVMLHAMPPLPTVYSNNYQIVQTPGFVAIYHEEIHETRVIPLRGESHLINNVNQWLGDSRGHWEGNTLVVETTNFKSNYDVVRTNGFILLDENAKMIERFTRKDADTIDYEFTVIDPTTYSKPWTAKFPWRNMDRHGKMLYEYACHEDNYSLYGMLAGARAQEKKAAGAKTASN